jgi:hypothetical protein
MDESPLARVHVAATLVALAYTCGFTLLIPMIMLTDPGEVSHMFITRTLRKMGLVLVILLAIFPVYKGGRGILAEAASTMPRDFPSLATVHQWTAASLTFATLYYLIVILAMSLILSTEDIDKIFVVPFATLLLSTLATASLLILYPTYRSDLRSWLSRAPWKELGAAAVMMAVVFLTLVYG